MIGRRSSRGTGPAPGVLVLLLALAILCAAPPASAALRVGQSSVSVKFRLSARQLLVELPRATPLGSRIRAGCGRSRLSGRRTAFTSRIFRGPRHLRFRLPQDGASTAEWCAFETEKSNVDARRLPHGAAALRPLLARPPKHLEADRESARRLRPIRMERPTADPSAMTVTPTFSSTAASSRCAYEGLRVAVNS